MIKTPETKSLTVPADVLAAALETWDQTGAQNLIPILGRSMLPLIQTGDEVLVEHGHANIRRGDVIIFLHQEKMVAHRLLRICEDGSITTFIAKGDNVSYIDPPVSVSQVVGRILKIKRGNRWIAIDTPAWRIGGWLIAIGMLGWTRLYGWGRNIKHTIWGNRSHYLTRILQRSVWGLSSVLLKSIILVVTFRWRS